MSAQSQADAQLTAQTRTVHQASYGTYCAPRVHAEGAAGGTRCGRKRVARLMRQMGWV